MKNFETPRHPSRHEAEKPRRELHDLARSIRDRGLFDEEAKQIFANYLVELEKSEQQTYDEVAAEGPDIIRPATVTDEFDDAPSSGEIGLEEDPALQAILKRLQSKSFARQLQAEFKDSENDPKRDVSNALHVIQDVSARLAKKTPQERQAAESVFKTAIQEPGGFKKALQEGNEHAILAALHMQNETVRGMEELIDKQMEVERPENLNLSKGLGVLGASVDIGTGVAAFGAAQAGTAKYLGALLRNWGDSYESLVALADKVNVKIPYILQEGTSDSGQKIVEFGTNATAALFAYLVVRGVLKHAKHLYQDTAREHLIGNSIVLTAAATPVIAAAKHPGRFALGAAALSAAAGAGALSVTHSLIAGTRAPDEAKLAEKKMEPLRNEITSAKNLASNTARDDAANYTRLFLLAESKGLAGFSAADAALAQSKGWQFEDPRKPTGELNLGEGPVYAQKADFMRNSGKPLAAAPKPEEQPKTSKKTKKAQAQQIAPAASKLTPEMHDKNTELLAALCRKHGFSPEETERVLTGRFEEYVAIRAMKSLVPAEQLIARRDKEATDTVAALADSSVAWTVLKDFSVVFATSGNEVPDAFRLIGAAIDEYKDTFDQFNDTIGKELEKEFEDTMKELGLPAGKFKLSFPHIGEKKDAHTEATKPGAREYTPYPHNFTDEDWHYLGKALYGDEKKFESSESRGWYLAKAFLIYGLLDFGSTIPAALLGMQLARRNKEEGPDKLSALNDFAENLSKDMAVYMNARVLPALRLITGINVPLVSPDSMRERMHALAEKEVTSLTPPRKQTRAQKLSLGIKRYFRIKGPESAERDAAFFEWLMDNVDRMQKSKSPIAAGDFFSRLYPEFGTLFIALAKYEQKGNAREIEKIKATGEGSARGLARTLLSDEIELQGGKAASVELALSKLYSQTDSHPIVSQYEDRGFAKELDGINNVVLLDVEARHFLIASRLEQVRAHAIKRLSSNLAAQNDLELRDAQKILAGDKTYVINKTEGRDPRKIIDRIKNDLGEEAASIVTEAENLTWRVLFGGKEFDTSLVNKQLSEINKKSVGKIKEIFDEKTLTNPMRYLSGVTPEFSYAYSDAHHRPTLFVGLTNPDTKLSLARVAYPGYIPDPSGDETKTTSNIIDWYRTTGQYELGARALNARLSGELANLREEMARALTTDGDTFDIVSVRSRLTDDHFRALARINVLTRIVERQDLALASSTRTTPVRREQLNPFFEEDSVLVGKSGVIEDANVVRSKFDRIVTASEQVPDAQKPRVIYSISTGILDIEAGGTRTAVPLHDFVSL